MITDLTYVNEERGVRLDATLFSHIPTSTRAFIRSAIAEGAVTVNGRSVPKGLKLRGGETIHVTSVLEANDNLVQLDRHVPIFKLFEDDAFLAFDKPAGMPVQPLSCQETGTLMNGVVARFPECQPLGDRPLMAGALHRIDADTSGLVLVARTATAFDTLRAQFTAQTVKKTYLALVEGSIALGNTLENDLVHEPGLPFCRMIDAHHNRLCESEKRKLKPLHAVTAYRPLGLTTLENEERTLLEVTIYTGVTHQIRAQLALAGIHIVNDRIYGAFAVENQIGHCLHAWSVELTHPVTGDPVKIMTPLPPWAEFIGTAH